MFIQAWPDYCTARMQLALTVLGHNLRTLTKLRERKEVESAVPGTLKNAA